MLFHSLSFVYKKVKFCACICFIANVLWHSISTSLRAVRMLAMAVKIMFKCCRILDVMQILISGLLCELICDL